ncbi:MAG TPA: Dabb family protein [Rubrivivax sp.]|nr:Dabb family protein [Rubrivivax sp.]
MFFHTVLMRLADPDAAFVARVEAYAARVRAELPYVRTYHFGSNLASRSSEYRWLVVAAFDRAEDHERYQLSRVHQEMKAFMAPRIEQLVAGDADTSEL